MPGDVFTSLVQHVRVHVWKAGDVKGEGADAVDVVIKLEVVLVGHVDGEGTEFFDVRKSAVESEPLAARAEGVQRDEGGVAGESDPERDLSGESSDREVEVARDLGERPRKHHSGEWRSRAHRNDRLNHTPYQKQARRNLKSRGHGRRPDKAGGRVDDL